MSNIEIRKSIFVPMVGQHENIGDIILRRPLLNWLRDSGPIHTYIGNAPSGYAEALHVRKGDTVYKSFGSWYWSALKAAARGRAHYAFKPGEIQLSIKGLKEHISVLPLLILIRLRGGKVIRVGSGARNFAKLPKFFMRPSIWFADLLLWRDAKTTEFMGIGDTMPDFGFAEGTADAAMARPANRNVLVLSMRGDRQDLSESWLDAIKQFSKSRSLEIYVVTQVFRDSALSQSLAQRLQARLLDWDGSGHDVQERKLRDLYDRTEVVISDRLHVLIAAFTHGAVPVGLLAYESDKIERHFEAAGIRNVCVNTVHKNTSEIIRSLEQVTTDRRRLTDGLFFARQQLRLVQKRIFDSLK